MTVCVCVACVLCVCVYVCVYVCVRVCVSVLCCELWVAEANVLKKLRFVVLVVCRLHTRSNASRSSW